MIAVKEYNGTSSSPPRSVEIPVSPTRGLLGVTSAYCDRHAQFHSNRSYARLSVAASARYLSMLIQPPHTIAGERERERAVKILFPSFACRAGEERFYCRGGSRVLTVAV